MTTLLVLRWIHLVAAATWTGGLIVLGALVLAMRRAGVDRSVILVAARQFARVTWVAMAVAVATGIGQVLVMGLPWAYTRLQIKVGLVALTIALALGHQLTAATATPARRGVVEALILGSSLAVFAAAVAL